MTSETSLPRRDLLKTLAAGAAVAATGSALTACSNTSKPAPSAEAKNHVMGLTSPKMDRVRIALVGCGARGQVLLDKFLRLDGVDITAICDIDPAAVDKGLAQCAKAGRQKPTAFSASPEDFRKVHDRSDVDLSIIATPWDWHVPMSVDAMKKGKHVGVEVPAATTLDGCWELVTTAEATRRHCVLLENCCYSPAALMMLSLTRQGLLGELLYGEGAYTHDLRDLLFSNKSEGLWRIDQHVHRNGNLYPTHGLGPVAQCMNVNRGDRFDYLTAMSSPSLGLQEFARTDAVPDTNKWKHINFACGDTNTSMIKTKNGKVIVVQHGVTTPTPYSRIDCIRGTNGVFMGYPDRIYVEGKSKKHDVFDTLADWAPYQHPIWKKLEEKALKAGGHGGMDFVMAYRLIYCLRNGLPQDIDVYDTAAWSAVGPISELSTAKRSAPIDFPDFTGGAWKSAKPLGIEDVA